MRHKMMRWIRLALASVAPTPLRVPRAEAILSDSPLTPAALEAAARAAMETAVPIDDVRSSAAYRRAMVKTLTLRAVQGVLATLSEATVDEHTPARAVTLAVH